MESISKNISNYINNLLIQLIVPKGYHNLKISKDNNFIFIDLICLSNLRGVNKLIPFIRDNFLNYINKDIIKLLSLINPIKSYIFIDFNIDETELKIIYKEIIVYLNPLIIPLDLLRVILNYLKEDDYINLLISLNFYNYKNLLYYISQSY